MHRSSRPIPLAAWIASGNPALRARAETALYHYGPDAGDALFAVADSISRFSKIKQSLKTLTVDILIVLFVVSVLNAATKADLTLVFRIFAIFEVLRAMYAIGEELYWRRKRLKIVGLALARRDDLRGIGPLLEAWRPLSISGRQLRDDEIELELTRILPQFLAQKSIDLRSYKKRILRRRVQRLFPYSFARRQVESRGQFSETRSDLLVTLIQLISRSSSESDHRLIERIGRMSTLGTHYIFERNAVFIRDAALAYRDSTPQIDETPKTAPGISTAQHSTPHPMPAIAKRL
jgi:hypothetical protein